MRKHLLNLKFLLMLCMIFCIGGGSVAFAEKITDYTKIVSGKKYFIRATTSDTDWYLKVDGSTTGTGKAGTAVTQETEATAFVFEGSGTSWTIKFDGTSNYLSLATSKANGKVDVVTSATAFTLSNTSKGLIRILKGSYSVQKNNTGAQFGSYANTQTDVWLEPIDDTPIKVSSSDLAFGNVETGTSKDLTFTLSGSNLTADATLSITGDNAGMFSVSPSSVSQTDGTISETTITVTYAPTSSGDHAATLNIASGEASATVDLSGAGIAPLTHYTVSWKVNGADYTTGSPSTEVAEGYKVTTLPTAPEAISGKVFVGWTNAEIASSQNEAPSVLFTTAASAPAVTDNTTYYAVFATPSGSAPAETLSQTLQYDTWTYSGSTTDKSSYRLFHTDSYIESAEFDLSTLSKVVVYGGTFGGDSYNKLNIGDGTNTWKDVTVSGKEATGENTYTDGTALSGTGKLRVTSKSGTASGTGVRISKVEIYTTTGGYTYSDYVTTIKVATLTGISVSGTAADLWTGDDFTHEGITVTATYDDGATADVTNSCTYNCDMTTAGEKTVTVTYGEKTASYTVNVQTIGNTKETAYTAAKAIELIDAGKGLKTPVYVKGIVSSIAQDWTSTNGYLSFWVSEDGTENKFEMYNNYKDEGKVKYSSADECPAVGDEVICRGLLYKYKSTYELNDGNYLVEKIVSTDPSSELTLSQTTGEVNVDKTLDIHGFVSTATGYTGTVTYAVTSGSEYASVSAEGVITGLAVGEATIKVTAPAVVGSFSETSAEFTVTVVEKRTSTTVTFGAEVDDQTFNVNLGETFEGKTATVSPAEAGNVTYASDKPEVASVDENGAITIGSKEGTATITASFAATDTHLASSAKYYITVTDPNGPVFYESFDSNDGTGGNDGKWSGSIASSDIQSDITGWTFTKGYGADQCAKFGNKDSQGSAVTPAIDLSGDMYVLTFHAGTWDQDAETNGVSIIS
ncbi:MAG: Ig-like domain-containing protein [Phocaeicola sp.]